MVFRDARGFELLASAAESRELDRRTIEEVGIPGRVLMELAGAGTVEAVVQRTGGRAGKAVVLCGGGQNGGDGYVIARHLADRGWSVRCVAASDPERLSGDARANHGIWVARGGRLELARARVGGAVGHALGHADVIVDALFGTGLSRPIEGPAAALIDEANQARHGLRVAVDLPSGLPADGATPEGVVFQAAMTATFGLAKPGLHHAAGAPWAGEVVVVGIALPRPLVDAVAPRWRLADEASVAGLLPRRDAAAHKGHSGHVGVVGGFAGKEGAAVLASLGALRGGAGLVTWNHVGEGSGVERPPELMFHSIEEGLDARSTVIVIGPGLGQDADARRALELALSSGRMLVMDADALNLWAASRGDAGLPSDTVLTPHPTEAARLLGVETAEVQRDRGAAAARLCERHGATVVLKGARTVVATPGRPSVIVPISEPVLAAAGTGDVLAGLIGALRAQGLDAHDAAVAGAFVHGLAGRRLGMRHPDGGVLASEVADAVAEVRGELSLGWHP
ncbi:MAG: NAD(P)H-hydrate dehydratase [Deltaproteobacteria bacterium]|nr:NAD(P)H-hydrate dehydratase [Deltaproteobacteria bacterium]